MADKRLKFAIVGVGGMGNNHIDGLYESEYAELTALCDPAGIEGIMKVRNASAQYKAKIDPKVNVYTDLADMLEFFGFEEDEESDISTVAGWVADQLGDIPAEGDAFTFGERMHVTVTQCDGRHATEIAIVLDEIETGEGEKE